MTDHSEARDEVTSRTGAWGLRISGLDDASAVLVAAPHTWGEVTVSVKITENPPTDNSWGSDRARYTLIGGNHIDIQRDPLSVRLALKRPTAEQCIVQPHLSGAASTAALWRGGQAFHGGAFLLEGAAWVLLADKGSGKSSTLAWIADAGHPVITDDLVIYQNGSVLAGPRCVDLRADAAQRFESQNLGVVGGRERWRMALGDCPSASPLAGWIYPEWGPEDALIPLTPVRNLERLPRHRALRLPWMNPETLLELATSPGLVWARRRSLAGIDDSTSKLLENLSALRTNNI